MPRYVVSHIDWFDHDLTSEIVEASDPVSAMKAHSKTKTYEWENQDGTPCETIEEMKQVAFDCDSMVNAIEI